MSANKTISYLLTKLQNFDGEKYFKVKNQLLGFYESDGKSFSFEIFHIQGSIGAFPASTVSLFFDYTKFNIDEIYFSDLDGVTGTLDCILRIFNKFIHDKVPANLGDDGSGTIQTVPLGQEMLKRSAISIHEKSNKLEIRFSISLAGTRKGEFLGKNNFQLFKSLFDLIENKILNLKPYEKEINTFFLNYKKFVEIRRYLAENNGISFIANNSLLPRESGISEKPLNLPGTTLFNSPKTFETTISLSDSSSIIGMIINEGITLITGAGFHGKSTLLDSITAGIYPHIPSDGREFVVTRKDAVFINSEDGRRVNNVDISPFINNLPSGKSTTSFTTDSASGSTSQASFIRESIDSGSSLLLFDEDKSATNFMVSDFRMREIIGAEEETITPLVDRLRDLWIKKNISSILVVSGLGDFLDIADNVILMQNYIPIDAITKRDEIVKRNPSKKINKTPFNWNDKHHQDRLKNFNISNILNPRYFVKRQDKWLERRIKQVRLNIRKIEYGMSIIDLNHYFHIIDENQARTIGFILFYLYEKDKSDKLNLSKTIENLCKEKGFDFLQTETGKRSPYSVEIRGIDIFASLNRIRIL